MESKFLVKKKTMEHDRDKATFQHEVQELHQYIRENKEKIEELEAKVIVAKRQTAAKEAEVREVLVRAEAAEENGRFLKGHSERRQWRSRWPGRQG